MKLFGRGGGRKKSIFQSLNKSMGIGPTRKRVKAPKAKLLPKPVMKALTKGVNKGKLPNL